MNTVMVGKSNIAPSKIICIGRNYVEHIQELGNAIPDEMVVFFKPNSAISPQLLAFHQEPLHYEGELCFMYQQGKFSAVAFGLDLTKRALQAQLKSQGLPWERAKAFNGAALFSEFVALEGFEDSLRLELKINGAIVQAGGVDAMMYKPDRILAELQTFVDLVDGDIVMTGTPKGVGLITEHAQFTGTVYQHDRVLVSQCWQATR